ncbi:induced myeloid leukemia cell differentiation protein Mcl-1b [Hippoglossus hippoglossus]|uniref:induced myeloid leukemia cell differentiation protein Mcl-1b n=1 Tax=Hippoglossus hippoglossus TaxID=8267 RepID=UPI00148E1C17|nr:induced myeloid leukemia cell differentiation protein Mcl-1b [Hippoglossus hippoglossus]
MLPTKKRDAFKFATGDTSCLFLPQNGVVDYGSWGNSSPQIVSHNGSAAEGPKRPKTLQVTASSAGYLAKNCRDNGSVDDGSLPSSPALDSQGEVDSCPAGDEGLDADTRELIGCFLRDFLAHKEPRWGDSKALTTMKRVVDDLLEKHRYAYNGMLNKLSLDNRADDVDFVSAVAKSLFSDNTTNWGRVASLVAFGAVVCQHLTEKRGPETSVELVGQEISTYLLTDQRDWLVKNNSWDGFVQFFRVSNPEATVRNTLLGLAGFAGIGALALLIR